MPEGPEVKIFAADLNKLLKNVYIAKIDLVGSPFNNNERPIFKTPRDRITQMNNNIRNETTFYKIRGVNSRGKTLVFAISSIKKEDIDKKIGDVYIGSTLGLTGKWVADQSSEARIVISYAKQIEDLNDKSKLEHVYYMDGMRQGKIYVETLKELKVRLGKLGPDIYDMKFDEFSKKILAKKNEKKEMQMVLVDQDTISGIGNYLRSEILYAAYKKFDIPYFIKVGDMSGAQIGQIFKVIKYIINKVYEGKGTELYGGDYKMMIYKKHTTGDKEVKTLRDSAKRTFYYVK